MFGGDCLNKKCIADYNTGTAICTCAPHETEPWVTFQK